MPSPRRAGFTLIEILIVVTIIAVLVGLLIVGIPMANRKVKEVKCANDLQQIGIGIETWRQDHDDAFPGRLVDLFDPARNGPYERGLEKLLICPSDQSRGTNGFNRLAAWDQYPELREDIADAGRSPVRPAPVRLAPCSYMYEASEQIITDAGLINAFYPNLPAIQQPASPTWGEGKKNQQKFGNKDGSGNPSAFPSSFFPVLRCYWHNRWTPANARKDEKVLNLSWDLNVFKSIPFWEHTVNPIFVVP